MNRKRLLKHLVQLMFFVFIVDRLAHFFFWYFSIWWFDMPMHFLGGFWVGLFFIYLFEAKDFSTEQSLKIILCALFIGVSWELFEIFASNYIGREPFSILDTSSDVFFDLAGGISALLYFSRDVMFVTANKVK